MSVNPVANRIGMWIALGLLVFGGARGVRAQESEPSAAVADERIAALRQLLTGVKLIGNFTVRGREDRQLTPEEYYILSAEKQDLGDYWTITARIKYASNDLTVPLPLEIKFAGDTPVITVDNLTIPGMGTFDARVLIRPDGYAGTWRHNDVGGLLFGELTKLTEAELEELRKSNRRTRSPDRDVPNRNR